MTEWLLIIVMGTYVPKASGLTQVGSDVKFQTFVDQRSCDAVKRTIDYKHMRLVECVEITKEQK